MPFLKLYRTRKASAIPEVLTQKQIVDALAKVDDERYRTCMILIYSCGLRAGEAVKVEVADFDKARYLLHIHNGKGAKDRLIPVTERTLKILREMWCKHHHPRWLFPAYYLNTRCERKRYGAKNKPLSAGVLTVHFKAALRASGYKGRASLHTLRHSYATHLLEAGVPLFTVKSYLGHSAMKSTMIYAHCTEKMRRDSSASIDELMRDL